ncbi:hypothetical protein A3F55_02025 [Candidatus Adlerbacteria bacterium RIFCSPHIGHO2_12_FULL_53_18]|uniref:Uncharacterized protein n=2 Tax=Parcubacteria group TaxID=1794811 RepID=A0A1F4XSI9_9BACT|nr:MAG: hypothetical protein A3F55_02025 [Candidatus Adlerbacteria bacterium RIFCSPHIGHO2_12_FULL_53_18]OGG51265.1 MAG: hypothetical protein A2704_01830 [Candidatus Kaiserbacteria bacterium RIFCSPHIGHO2_01_FULL_54_36b]
MRREKKSEEATRRFLLKRLDGYTRRMDLANLQITVDLAKRRAEDQEEARKRALSIRRHRTHDEEDDVD